MTAIKDLEHLKFQVTVFLLKFVYGSICTYTATGRITRCRVRETVEVIAHNLVNFGNNLTGLCTHGDAPLRLWACDCIFS